MTDNIENPRKTIFICWSGKFGQKLANHLKEEMLNVAPFEGWVSDQDITPGSAFFEQTKNALRNSSFGIVLLTPGSLNSRWINFEAGFIYGRLDNCIILQFQGKVLSPLDNIQVYDGTKQDTWLTVFKWMNPEQDEKQRKAWVNYQFPLLQQLLNELDEPPYSYLNEIGRKTTSIVNSINELKKNENALGNTCFQQVILNSFQELENQVKNINTRFSLPASKYPFYLLSSP